MLEFKGTPGPWRWELNEKFKQVQLVGGKPRFDVIVMDFVRYGFNRAAPRFNSEIRPNCNVMVRAEKFAKEEPGRRHHADWFKVLDHPDANLIEGAPGLLTVCIALAEWDKKHPKGMIHPIGPDDAEKQLDRICEQARTAVAAAFGESKGVEK